MLSLRKLSPIAKNKRIKLSKNDKNGITYRKQKSWKRITRDLGGTKQQYIEDEIKLDKKLLSKYNRVVCIEIVKNLIKKCLLWFFVLAIIDVSTFKSGILLIIIIVIAVAIVFSDIFYMTKKWLTANKQGKFID
ncbi:hypothetical protein [Clostridium pasteurianum]|uniref:Uncharacterized protein n=1 Tax=Clostridium pasteurianum BC1 TaxID=86416 RepID=R4K119_CLOPA|nr:hypothetical protein [Clostridium pasteurianum]AGK96787.1 hypothetical protein Clopa_1887 [Clostridium pasteurianum BC1]